MSYLHCAGCGVYNYTHGVLVQEALAGHITIQSQEK